MTTNTETKLKDDLEKVLEAPPGTIKKITVSLGEDIDFICEPKSDESPGKGKTVVAYTAYKEEKEEPFKIIIKDLMATLDQSIANLLPEGLQNQSINFKNLMVIYRKEDQTSPRQWLFTLDLDIETKIKLKSLPVVGDLIADEIAKEEIVPSLRIIAASKAFTIKEIRVLNDKIPKDDDDNEIIPPLPVPKEKGTDESEAKRSFRKGFSFSGQLALPDASRILSLQSVHKKKKRRRKN